QQCVERERAVARHHDLAVEHEFVGWQRPHRLDQLGEIAGERLTRLRLQVDARPTAIDQAAEAVPLRLVLPLRTGWNLVDRLSLHGRKWRPQRKRHGGPRRYVLKQ